MSAAHCISFIFLFGVKDEHASYGTEDRLCVNYICMFFTDETTVVVIELIPSRFEAD